MIFIFMSCVDLCVVMLHMLLEHPDAQFAELITRNKSGTHSEFIDLHSSTQLANFPVFTNDKNNQQALITRRPKRKVARPLCY